MDPTTDDTVVSPDHDHGPAPDPVETYRCEIVIALLARKWMIPILLELDTEPRRRKYLFRHLRVSSSRLDPTIQALTRWGLVERTWIVEGCSDSPALAITPLGESFLSMVTTLGAWQHEHHPELVANNKRWTAAHYPDRT